MFMKVNIRKETSQFKNPGYIFFALLIFLITIAIYGQVYRHEFVSYDDDLYVTKNAVVQQGITFHGIFWAFSGSHIGNYHPLTWLSHMLDVHWFGLNSGIHHLVNVLIHAVNGILIFLLFQKMTANKWPSLLIALLFVIHPVHVESVAWISERKDLLSTFFWLLTMRVYINYTVKRGTIRYLLVILFFLMGLLCKAMLVTLPFVLLLIDYWPLKRFYMKKEPSVGRQNVLLLIIEKVPLFLFSFGFSLVAFLSQRSGGGVISKAIYPLGTRLANAFVSYMMYISKMVWPSDLAVFYPHPGTVQIWQTIAAAALLAVITFLSFAHARKRPWYLIGWLWYLGTLVPVIGFVQIGNQAMADRYSYVPLIGLFIMVAWGMEELWTKRRLKRVMITCLISVLLIYAAIAWNQVGYWKNSQSLYKHALSVTKDNYLAHNNLGMVFYNQGRLKKALPHFREALRFKPQYIQANNNMGMALIRIGYPAKALPYLGSALRVNPNYAEANNNMGAAFLKLGKAEQARVYFERVVSLQPKDARWYNNLGAAYYQLGKQMQALKMFQMAVDLNPDYDEARKNLTIVSQ